MSIYNDQQITNSTQAELINKVHNENEEQKSHDLLTLHEELRKQREYMFSVNSDHSLDNLIESTDNHISILSTMLNKKSVKFSQVEPNTPQPHFRPYIPNNIYNNGSNNINNNTDIPNLIPNQSGLPNTNNNIPNTDNNLNTPNTLPNNITQPNNTDNNNSRPNGSGRPNTNNNVPNIDNNLGPTPINPNENRDSNSDGSNLNTTQPTPNNNRLTNNRNRTRIGSRSSPLQSGIISLARSIFGRFRPVVTINEDSHRNRFHNAVTELSNCKPHNKLITNECNILRLLLLYITLHPHCPHTCTLSTIANDRLGILMQLM